MCVITQNGRQCLYQTDMVVALLVPSLLLLICIWKVGDTVDELGVRNECKWV